MKQKIIDTSVTVSDGGRAKEYWALRVLNPKRAQQEDKSKDVDMVAILKKYNLKGFEFGNWLSNNDRYDFVHAFTRAFQTMEEITGSKNLGMDLLLGVAFGARGRGGSAAAHYEPCMNMINLTKTTGSGTLAHEWGHAIDYNLGRYVDQNKTYDALTGGHSMARTLPNNTGAQLRKWANAVVDEVMATKSYERLKDYDDYWHRRTEVWARFFEQYICYMCKLKKISNTFLTQSWSGYCAAPTYLTEADFKPIADGSMFSFMIVLKGVLNNKYNLTACTYAHLSKDHKHSSTLYEKLKSAQQAEVAKEPKKPAQKKASKKPSPKKAEKQPEPVKDSTVVREWYHKNFPTDDQHTTIREKMTFGQLYAAMKDGKLGFYVLAGENVDTVIRERIMTAIARWKKTTYEAVYKMGFQEKDHNAKRIAQKVNRTPEEVAILERILASYGLVPKKVYQKPTTTARPKDDPKPSVVEKIAKADKETSTGKGYGYFSGKEWYDKAVNAHYWGSFDPERRGQSDCEMYSKALEEDLKHVPEDYKADYIKTFQAKVSAVWAAESKVASAAVTGPAKFNVRKHDRAAASWTSRENELAEWRASRKKYFAKVIESRKTPDEKQSDELKDCKKIVNSAVHSIGFARSYGSTSNAYAASRAYDSLERVALRTKDEKLMEKVLDYVREVNAAFKKEGMKPLFTDRHKVWQLPEVAKKAAGKQQEKLDKGNESKEYKGFTVIKNVEEDRLQIDFDSKPGFDVISLLKKHGFKWSAKNSVWQRQLTANCAYAYRQHVLPELKKAYGID